MANMHSGRVGIQVVSVLGKNEKGLGDRWGRRMYAWTIVAGHERDLIWVCIDQSHIDKKAKEGEGEGGMEQKNKNEKQTAWPCTEE